LEDLVRLYDLQLDVTMKQRIAAALAALVTITVPFGQAIIEQPVQVQQAINARIHAERRSSKARMRYG
jgi:hypothetical protein